MSNTVRREVVRVNVAVDERRERVALESPERRAVVRRLVLLGRGARARCPYPGKAEWMRATPFTVSESRSMLLSKSGESESRLGAPSAAQSFAALCFSAAERARDVQTPTRPSG